MKIVGSVAGDLPQCFQLRRLRKRLVVRKCGSAEVRMCGWWAEDRPLTDSMKMYNFDCKSSNWISSPYVLGTVVKNVFVPYEEYTLQDPCRCTWMTVTPLIMSVWTMFQWILWALSCLFPSHNGYLPHLWSPNSCQATTHDYYPLLEVRTASQSTSSWNLIPPWAVMASLQPLRSTWNFWARALHLLSRMSVVMRRTARLEGCQVLLFRRGIGPLHCRMFWMVS